MAYNKTTTTYNSSYSSTTYPIGFQYSDPSEISIRCFKDGAYVIITDWEFVGSEQIRFTGEAPDYFEIIRSTDISQSYGEPAYSVFNTGSMINASDLNGNFELLRRAIEENSASSSDGLQEQIDTINGNIVDIQGDITLINTDLTEIKNDISEINTDIVEIRSDITALNTRIDNLVINASQTVVSPTTPDPASFEDGTLWFNSSEGNLYVLYNDGDSRQWVITSSSSGGGGGSSGGGIEEAPVDGTQYARQDGGWTAVTSSGGISDAPADGTPYARQDNGWLSITPDGVQIWEEDASFISPVNVGAGLRLAFNDIGLNANASAYFGGGYNSLNGGTSISNTGDISTNGTVVSRSTQSDDPGTTLTTKDYVDSVAGGGGGDTIWEKTGSVVSPIDDGASISLAFGDIGLNANASAFFGGGYNSTNGGTTISNTGDISTNGTVTSRSTVSGDPGTTLTTKDYVDSLAGGSVIKSIQRISGTLSAFSATIPITAVDLNKSIINWTGAYSDASGSQTKQTDVTVAFTDETTITMTRYSNIGAYTYTFDVVEFN